jgi:hypothetical protein
LAGLLAVASALAAIGIARLTRGADEDGPAEPDTHTAARDSGLIPGDDQ